MKPFDVPDRLGEILFDALGILSISVMAINGLKNIYIGNLIYEIRLLKGVYQWPNDCIGDWLIAGSEIAVTVNLTS